MGNKIHWSQGVQAMLFRPSTKRNSEKLRALGIEEGKVILIEIFWVCIRRQNVKIGAEFRYYNFKGFVQRNIAMGWPISGSLAEIYLQVFLGGGGELLIKHWVEISEMCYRRYVDDIIIIFDQNKFNKDSIINCVNNIHKYLEFKLTEEVNYNINYWMYPHTQTTITYN